MTHKTPIRIYYEDTDAGGVVYHANYLKFAERGRTELLRAAGFGNKSLRDGKGILFVVRHIQADYRKPGFLDDHLELLTSITELNNASLVMQQTVFRNDEILCDMAVTIVCVDDNFKPVRLSDDIREKFLSYLKS